MCKMVETSLVFVTEVHNQDVSIRVARVCGTDTAVVGLLQSPVELCSPEWYVVLRLEPYVQRAPVEVVAATRQDAQFVCLAARL